MMHAPAAISLRKDYYGRTVAEWTCRRLWVVLSHSPTTKFGQ